MRIFELCRQGFRRSCGQLKWLLLPASTVVLLTQSMYGVSCATASQMTAAQRDQLSSAGRAVMVQVQNGDVQGLRANTIAPVAADFGAIADSVTALKPLIHQATITVENLYALDATQETAGSQGAQFFCSPAHSLLTVVLNFNELPQGKYAVVILHATGVKQPQQISLVLAESGADCWQLAGFFAKPMSMAGHDGVWYWIEAREYAGREMDWNAWFYYQTAAFLLNPADFLSSPNLEKLRHERDQLHPQGLPGVDPVTLDVHGSTFRITGVDTSGTLGALDLVVHYAPDPSQANLLRDPVGARNQALDLMRAVLSAHPELRTAFHGIWVHADRGNVSLFALELPMDEIAGTQTEQQI